MSDSTTKKFIKEVIKKNFPNQEALEAFKKEFCRDLRKEKKTFRILSNADIKRTYLKMLAKKEIKPSEDFEKLLITKKIRTLSGVAVVAVLTKSYPCPGKCIYCPDEKSMPKSYLSNEPAVMRAIGTNFHPYAQTQARLKMFEINGHSIEKIEMIVMGGTFNYFSKKYQNWFIKECYRALNDYPKNLIEKSHTSSLEIEKEKNQTAFSRMVGLTLETRPDYINPKEITYFRKLGATRVELGIQSIYNDVLKLNNRGHLVEASIEATKLLKEAGFKINYHLMPGMYGSSFKKDLEMFKELFSNPDFQPDMIKIYPCVVTKNSKLYQLWKTGKYQPLSNEENEKLMIAIKKIIPSYVRITRLIRDIPEESIEAGPNISNLRQILQQKKVRCQCIRCREVRADYQAKEDIVLDRINYPASNGKEIFLQFVSQDKSKLFALLRLRINNPKTSKDHFLPVLKNSAIIRELHTYGKSTKLKTKSADSPQHLGLGKKLVLEAEKIASQEFRLNKISVISGVGVRGYYEKLGYELEKEYMVKKLT
jgi:elongator complex protein 3